MANVVWRTAALDDLDDITVYIKQFDPLAATRVRSRLTDLADSLIHFPRRGRPLEDGSRELATVSPYIIAYQVGGDTVTILSVRHGARNITEHP